MGDSVEQCLDREDHPRRAEAALDRARVHKRLLEGVRLIRRADALNRHNVAAVRLLGEHTTGVCGAAILDDGARTALAELAAAFYAGQARLFAQEMQSSDSCGSASNDRRS